MAYSRRVVKDYETVMNKDLYDNLQDGINELKQADQELNQKVEKEVSEIKENQEVLEQGLVGLGQDLSSVVEEFNTKDEELSNDLKETQEDLEATNQGLTELGSVVSDSVEKLDQVSENLEKVSVASGYGSSVTVTNDDGSITQTFSNGTVVHTVFNPNDTITETTSVNGVVCSVKTIDFRGGIITEDMK